MTITQKHYEEWTIGSGVHPDIVALNVGSLSGEDPYSELLYSDKVPRRNDGRLRDGVLKQYHHIEAGGWWCSGVDILTGEESQWGCFKPDFPRYTKDGKEIKYEHPYKSPTEAFFLRVSFLVSWFIVLQSNNQEFIDEWLKRFEKFLKTANQMLWSISCSHDGAGKTSPSRGRTKNNRAQRRVSAEKFARIYREFQEASQRREYRKISGLLQEVLRYLGERGDSGMSASFRSYGTGVRRVVGRLEDRGFWQSVINCRVPIIITEGGKKAGSLLTTGYVAIALPGIYNGYRTPKDQYGMKIGKPHLIPQLEPFADGRKITFAFDQDEKPKTVLNVRKATYNTAKLFLDAHSDCQCYVAEWSQAKGIDDLLVAQGEAVVKGAIAQATDFFGFLADGVRQLTYPVTQSIDPNLRYLPDLNLESSGKVIALKAPKGKGKTQAVVQTIKRIQLACLILGHRNNLMDHLSQRCNIVSNGDLRSPESQEILIQRLCTLLGISDLDELRFHFESQSPIQLSLIEENDDDELFAPTLEELIEKGCELAGIQSLNELRDTLGFALCCDSLHEKAMAGFRPEQWRNCVLFIDEIEQVLWHCVNGKTAIKKYRVKILQILEELVLQVYHSPQGRIIVADADLSDLTIQWLQALFKVGLHFGEI